jgi:hypothetical protein
MNINAYQGGGVRSDNRDKFEEERRQKFLVQIGRVTRTLLKELPLFMEHGLITTSIYSSNIVFFEPHHQRFVTPLLSISNTVIVSLQLLASTLGIVFFAPTNG